MLNFRKSSAAKWYTLLTVLFFTLSTQFLLIYVDRFYVQNRQILEDSQFLLGQLHWKEHGSGTTSYKGDQITITNSKETSHGIFQNVVVNTPTYLKLTFEAASTDLDYSREEYWIGANGSIMSRDSTEKVTKVNYVAIIKQASTKKSYSHIGYFEDGIASVDVSFRLAGSIGSFHIKNPVLSVLDESPHYRILKYLITGFWIFAGAGLLIAAFRLVPIRQLALAVLLLAVSLFGTLIPEGLIITANQKLALMIPKNILSDLQNTLGHAFGLKSLTTSSAGVSKLGHFLVFMLIGFLTGWNYRKIGVIFGIACISVFALLTEVLQMLVNGRSTSLNDFYIDVSGGFLGLIIGIICLLAYEYMRPTLSR